MHISEFKVRDYELDSHRIVNNSVYGNYYEHARHEFLLDNGVDFFKLAKNDINLVLIKSTIEYLKPLVSQDRFLVHTNCVRESTFKFRFHQKITHQNSGTILSSCSSIAVPIDAHTKRPVHVGTLDVILPEIDASL